MFVLLTSCILFHSILIVESGFAPLVQTKNGPVRGIIGESEDGQIYKYMGIPYASVDHNNKFGHALPVTPWEDVLEANTDSIQCPQREEFHNQLIGSIDCLVLYVYVPKINSSDEKLPVMVWTHGGQFEFGYGGQYLFGPEKLVRHGVILVTYNYRLGPYGFMCLGNDQAPGNAALKDSVEAFRWVNENIHAFGGDPNDITAFGQSAGAFVTEFLMLPPISRDLFQKVILESGTILGLYYHNYYDDNLAAAEELAYSLGYLESGFNDTISFLSSVPEAELIQGQESLDMDFGPCLERESNDSFLSKQPIEYYLDENFISKPMIAGFNNKEAMNSSYEVKGLIDSNSPSLEGIFYDTLSENFNLESEISKIVREFYFGDKNFDLEGWIEFESDIYPNYQLDRSVSLHLKKSNGPIFFYLFGYDGDRNYEKVQRNYSTPGAAHGDELSYLFLQPWIVGLSDRDRVIMDRMTAMWTNFAKYANPTPVASELLPIKWEPINDTEKNYLYIDTKMYMDKKVYHKRIAFWDLIYKNYCDSAIGVQRDEKNMCRKFFYQTLNYS